MTTIMFIAICIIAFFIGIAAGTAIMFCMIGARCDQARDEIYSETRR